MTYTDEQINKAFNRAADEASAVEWNDSEAVRDACNLVVNLGAHYLAYPEATMREAIVESYGDGEWTAAIIEMAGA